MLGILPEESQVWTAALLTEQAWAVFVGPPTLSTAIFTWFIREYMIFVSF